LGGDRLRQRIAVGQQQGRCQRIVLGLGQEVCGHVFRPGRRVRHNQDLTRSGEHVDVDLAEHQALGCVDIDVARARDLVDRRDRGGSVGHGRNRLGTAHTVDLIGAGQ